MIDYKSELINVYTSLYFAYIFLYSVRFKLLFNSKQIFSCFYCLLVEYDVLKTVNSKTP
jgi:hypothetical protein